MKTREVGTLEAKTQLSHLLSEVQRGKSFLITRHGRGIAMLGPVRAEKRRGGPGFAKGFFRRVADDFDAPLTDFAPHQTTWEGVSPHN